MISLWEAANHYLAEFSLRGEGGYPQIPLREGWLRQNLCPYFIMEQYSCHWFSLNDFHRCRSPRCTMRHKNKGSLTDHFCLRFFKDPRLKKFQLSGNILTSLHAVTPGLIHHSCKKRSSSQSETLSIRFLDQVLGSLSSPLKDVFCHTKFLPLVLTHPTTFSHSPTGCHRLQITWLLGNR